MNELASVNKFLYFFKNIIAFENLQVFMAHYLFW